MRRIRELLGLTYAKLGTLMGEENDQDARNRANYLLNQATNPELSTVLRFCDAVEVQIDQLLALDVPVEQLLPADADKIRSA